MHSVLLRYQERDVAPDAYMPIFCDGFTASYALHQQVRHRYLRGVALYARYSSPLARR